LTAKDSPVSRLLAEMPEDARERPNGLLQALLERRRTGYRRPGRKPQESGKRRNRLKERAESHRGMLTDTIFPPPLREN
jgi:hypothetical protein